MGKGWYGSRLKSYRIALCGMAMALSAALMLLGHSLSFGEYFWYFIAALFVDLPERGMDKGLCCLGSCLLSCMLCGFNWIYLCSYLFLMAPYPVVKHALHWLRPLPRYLFTALFWWAGMAGIMWFTPMFVLQLSLIEDAGARILCLLALLGIALVIDPFYARLHGMSRKLLLKVMFHLS